MPLKPPTIIFVYFISDGEYIKIGKSNNPDERLNEIQIYNARNLKLLGTTPYLEEKELHSLFAHIRIRGEWFENTKELQDFIFQNKSQYWDFYKKDKFELLEYIITELEGEKHTNPLHDQ